MGVIWHLIKTAFRAFFSILFAVIVAGALGAGLALLVSWVGTSAWPPSHLGVIAAAAVGVLAAYAGGLTVLVREAVRGLLTAAGDVEKDVKGAVDVAEGKGR
ncbi:MAG TPA: hypothetical protein VIC85_17410 [Ktedonobacterales bacterium]|jgi:hypothetical protein